MNPVLIKPSGERRSHVMLMGTPYGEVDARGYGPMRRALRAPVLGALEDLRARFDVVVCEGAGSPAEINLRDGDLANMGLARAADLPVVVVGDIDRGGVFAGLFGCLALLEPDDQRLIAAFLVNKFRGDPGLLQPGLDTLRERTGRPTLGVLPWRRRLWLDAEDSLALEVPREGGEPPLGPDALEVAVVRLRWMSNFTDLDALAAEPGVRGALHTLAGRRGPRGPGGAARHPGHGGGSRAPAGGRARRRAGRARPAGGAAARHLRGVPDARRAHRGRGGEPAGRGPGPRAAPRRDPLRAAEDPSRRGRAGAGAAGAPASGYEIRHGRVRRLGAAPLIETAEGDEGCRDGAVLGTSWHGLLEGDGLRRALLAWVADLTGRRWVPGDTPFALVRERRLDDIGDLDRRPRRRRRAGGADRGRGPARAAGAGDAQTVAWAAGTWSAAGPRDLAATLDLLEWVGPRYTARARAARAPACAAVHPPVRPRRGARTARAPAGARGRPLVDADGHGAGGVPVRPARRPADAHRLRLPDAGGAGAPDARRGHRRAPRRDRPRAGAAARRPGRRARRRRPGPHPRRAPRRAPGAASSGGCARWAGRVRRRCGGWWPTGWPTPA